MANVILGLLMLWPQSLYELTKSFEAGISLFYSASTGSIKRALDRLSSAGFVELGEESGPRGKKLYSITDAGRGEFRRWMLSEVDGSDVETAVLSRVYFLGLLEPQARAEVGSRIRRRISADLAQLQAFESQVGGTAIPEGYEAVAEYQFATLRYGLAAQRMALEWAESQLP